MNINGYWLGVSIISMIDYIWLMFVNTNYSDLVSLFTASIVVITLGLAIKSNKLGGQTKLQR